MSLLARFTTCRHCGKKFVNPEVEQLIDKRQAAADLNRFASDLTRHIHADHKEISARLQLEATGIVGFLHMMHFEQTQPEFVTHMQQIAADLRNRFIKAGLIDDPTNQPTSQPGVTTK